MCHFCNCDSGICTILLSKGKGEMFLPCTGINPDCKFMQTEEEFRRRANEAIRINREKGNCSRCKYRTKHCEIVYRTDSGEIVKE